MATIASDTFSRTTAGGWGIADTGGAWTVSQTQYFSTNGSGAVISAAAGSTTYARLASLSNLSTEIFVSVSTAALPNVGTLAFNINPRSVADSGTGSTSYGAHLLLSSTGTLQIATTVNPGSTTGYTTAATGVVAGSVINARVQTVGSNPTTLSARAWLSTATEPTGWNVSITDATAVLQTPAAIALGSYLSSSNTNGPVAVTWDNLVVSTVVTATANPITVTATPLQQYLISASSSPQNGGAMTYSILPSTSVTTLNPGVWGVPVPADGTQVTYSVTATETYASGSVVATTNVTVDGNTPTVAQTYNTLVRVNGAWQ